MSETVRREQRGRTHILIIDRPGAANAIDLDTSQALADAFDELETDADTWAVVLTAAGERVFCAGMDLKAVEAGQADAINRVSGGFGGIVRRQFAKPLIAAVNGAAMGGGFELVLACDLAVAAQSARFGLPELRRGLIAASGGALRLARRIPAVTADGPLAVAASKRLARSMLSVSEDEGWRLNDELTRTIMASADAAEAAQEKREPRWEAR